MMHSIDTHSHLNLPPFADDKGVIIARMQEVGIGTITVGIDSPTSMLAVSIARMHEGFWACVGQHPTEWQTPFESSDFIQLLEQDTLEAKKSIVAIGECGLDYYRPISDEGKRMQKDLFLAHISLAQHYNLPLMLHIRPSPGTMDAYEDALLILEKSGPTIGTAHFFVGTPAIAARFIALGYYISFSGVITFASEYAEVVSFVPLERILSETDAPFAAPVPHRGKRNEPLFVTEVISAIASIKNLPRNTVQEQLFKNACTLFSLPVIDKN